MFDPTIFILGTTVQIWFIVAFLIMILLTGLHFVTEAGPKIIILAMWFFILLIIIASLTTGTPAVYR